MLPGLPDHDLEIASALDAAGRRRPLDANAGGGSICGSRRKPAGLPWNDPDAARPMTPSAKDRARGVRPGGPIDIVAPVFKFPSLSSVSSRVMNHSGGCVAGRVDPNHHSDDVVQSSGTRVGADVSGCCTANRFREVPKISRHNREM